MGLEPLFQAWSYFRRRKFRECADVCSQLLERPPGEQELDSEYTVFQAAWNLKTRALTEMVYVDEIDLDQEGIAEILLDENAIAQVARPGTSLKLPGTGQGGGPSPAVRPVTQSGRPITGFVRPSTQSGRPSTMEQAIRTPRTALTARPITSASGGYVRPGTASMITNPDGPFINLSRLNLTKYAQKPKLAKALFEYIFHHENDIKNALDLAALATEYAQFKDWWWKVQIGKCYYRLGLYREAEKQFKSALKQQDMVDTFLYLAKVYLRLDQPVTALNLFKQGLERFPGEVTLICGIARIYEGIGDLNLAYQCFKLTLVNNNDYAEAYNNLAVLEMRKGHTEQARALLQTASSLAPHMYEPHFNVAILSEKVGDLQRSYTAAQKSEEAFPGHVDTQQLIKQLKEHFAML
ncbi:tetratricopeptide repeat protein 8 isoform X2 [Haemorhous mexicanus]|uniref:tetratricopeptide repeat protein 8 isoform X2 n=1 Tax=Haemorhous mexicanus TaxID=30427 RepID=UPI0028BF108D|nr:tetratricopeptide repeat protein 8 isoform X2 [Haemorhous mexicanus]